MNLPVHADNFFIRMNEFSKIQVLWYPLIRNSKKFNSSYCMKNLGEPIEDLIRR